MNATVARMMGRPLEEDDVVPLPAGIKSPEARGRSRLSRARRIHRTTAAMMMGLGEAEHEEDEDSIIPDDAEPIDNVAGISGIKLDKEKFDQDREPDEPSHPVTPDEDAELLMTPKDALVAPDVTPQAFEPIDPSEVPAPKETAQAKVEPVAVPKREQPQVNPMDVLLGRVSPGARPAQGLPEEPIVTAEAAQATVNTVLGASGGGEGLLKRGQPMPDPEPGKAGKIMEAFSKYGPRHSF